MKVWSAEHSLGKKETLIFAKVIHQDNMGIVLGIEAAIGIAEAAEAAAGAAEIASAGEAADVIAAGAETGADAGADAGETAANALDTGGDAVTATLDLLNKDLLKLGKMVAEFAEISTTFKVAKKILEKLSSDPSAQARAKKLEKLINVLNQSSQVLESLCHWLSVHSQDTTNINEITVTIQGVLSKFLPQLGAVSASIMLTNQ